MECVNCHNEIPAKSRFCLNCGAAQPDPTPTRMASADGGVAPEKDETPPPEFSWMAREMQLDPTMDYEAQRRYSGAVGQAIGCMGSLFFLLIGVVLLIPTVPILAVFGLPLAVVLGVLTFFDVGRLQERVRGIKILKKLPGFTSPRPAILALSVSGYLAVASLISLLLMIANSARHPL